MDQCQSGICRVADLENEKTGSDILNALRLAGKHILNIRCERGEKSSPSMEDVCSVGEYLYRHNQTKIVGLGLSSDSKDRDIALLSGLQNVKYIDFNENKKVTDAGLASLREMPLEQLDLVNTRVTDAGMNYLAEIPTLKSLNLNSTRISSIGLQALAKLKDLRILNLGYTKVDDFGMEILAQMPSLEILYLGSTQISSEGIRRLTGHSRLKSLDLRASRIRPETIEYLATLPALTELSINMGDSALVHLKLLSRLEELNLFKDSIGDKGIRSIRDCHQLKKLHIISPIDETQLGHICRLTNLTELYCNLKGTFDLSVVTQMVDLNALYLKLEKDISKGWLEPLHELKKLTYLSLCPKSCDDNSLLDIGRISSLEGISVLWGKTTETGLNYLKDLRNLKSLNMSCNIEKLGVDLLTNFQNLESLNLFAHFSPEGLRVLGSLKHLEDLSIYTTSNFGYEHLRELPNLRKLNCGSSINDEVLGILSTFPRLSEIKADSAVGITDAGILKLSALSSLTHLCILNSREVTTRGVKALRKAMPGALDVWN